MIKNPIRIYTVVALVSLAVLMLLLWHYVKVPLFYSYIGGLSLVTFVFYGYDKRQSIKGKIRVPELILHLLALAGGTFGALAGQTAFKHKTSKRKFLLIFWGTVLLQILVAGFYWYYTAS